MELKFNNITHYYDGMHKKKPKAFSYYDTPDGENLLEKLFHCTKIFGGIGIFFGLTNSYLIVPHPSSRVKQLAEILRVAAPFFLCSATFTIVEYTSAKIRSKDDELNAQIGGVTAGLIYGAWARKPGVGITLAAFLGISCGLKKIWAKNGYIYPNSSHVFEVNSSWALRKFDFTLKEDIRGDWISKKSADASEI